MIVWYRRTYKNRKIRNYVLQKENEVFLFEPLIIFAFFFYILTLIIRGHTWRSKQTDRHNMHITHFLTKLMNFVIIFIISYFCILRGFHSTSQKIFTTKILNHFSLYKIIKIYKNISYYFSLIQCLN